MAGGPPTAALLATRLRMKRAGRSVVLVQVGGADALTGRDGLPGYRVPDDIPWQDLDTLVLQGMRQ